MQQFTYTALLPGFNRSEKIKELHFNTYKHLVKCITNDNNKIIADFFNNMLAELCDSGADAKRFTYLDKIILLLTIRAICLAPDLELNVTCPETGNIFKYTISVSDIIDRLQKFKIPPNIINYTKSYDNGLTIVLGMPDVLETPTDENIFKTLIKRIIVKEEDVDVTDLIIEQLPVIVLNDIKTYLTDFSQQLEGVNVIEITSPYGQQHTAVKIPLNIFTGSIIEFLKLCFRRDLLLLYELEYSIIHKLNMSYNLVKSSTPAELLTYINLYREEKKDEESTQKKQQHLNPLHP